ncbi:MAG: methyl-viologen-reducing hydrogenase subunit delta [Candidatus Latescibacteria bacterium 4484_7]|nr:MAG: methyl-viologen-reducing hydrogenase subunit delta [Candidatus Latescibacteria bacterium 4484_7]
MNAEEVKVRKRKILLLATEACAYPGADSVGQSHLEFPTDTYIIKVRSPVLFPEDFYMRAFEKGVDAIVVMSCGHECPYKGAYDKLAARISKVYAIMKEKGMDTRRLKLCAICTVCIKAFLKEVKTMRETLDEIEAAEGEG